MLGCRGERKRGKLRGRGMKQVGSEVGERGGNEEDGVKKGEENNL